MPTDGSVQILSQLCLQSASFCKLQREREVPSSATDQKISDENSAVLCMKVLRYARSWCPDEHVVPADCARNVDLHHYHFVTDRCGVQRRPVTRGSVPERAWRPTADLGTDRCPHTVVSGDGIRSLENTSRRSQNFGNSAASSAGGIRIDICNEMMSPLQRKGASPPVSPRHEFTGRLAPFR